MQSGGFVVRSKGVTLRDLELREKTARDRRKTRKNIFPDFSSDMNGNALSKLAECTMLLLSEASLENC